MPHEVDSAGYPIDPKLRELEGKLHDLAGELRSVYRGIEGQIEIVNEYHVIMQQLYDLGWDGVLDFEGELPDHLMPKEYLKRHR